MEIKDYFLINPAAGRKNRVSEMKERIRNTLDLLQREARILISSRPGEVTQLVKRLAAEHPHSQLRFYVCGGDGTFQQAVQGAVHQPHVAVAPVPIGSGNDFIRSFDRYRKEDFMNLSALMQGEIQRVDALDVNGTVGVNVASVGMDAKTAKLMPALRRVPFLGGSISYVFSLGIAFFTATKNRFSFEVDGRNLDYGKKECIIATAANGRYYGGGFQTAPRARMDDGEMDFLCVPSISRLRFLSLVGLYKRGEHLEKLNFIQYRRCKTLRICCDKPILVNVDGEVFSMENPTLRLLEKALNVILPRKELLARE